QRLPQERHKARTSVSYSILRKQKSRPLKQRSFERPVQSQVLQRIESRERTCSSGRRVGISGQARLYRAPLVGSKSPHMLAAIWPNLVETAVGQRFELLQRTPLDLGAGRLRGNVHQLARLEGVRHTLTSRSGRDLLLLDLHQARNRKGAGAFVAQSLLDFAS